jgi:tetratricopeptide (TPR) repeat protein
MNVSLFDSKKPGAVLALALLAVASLGVAGCNKLKARDKLNQGVTAYKNGQPDQAIEDFKQSKDLDPTLLMARLYLATAYQGQYIPGAPSEENKRNGDQALLEYQDVLKIDPNNLTAIDGVGSLLFAMGTTPYDAAKLEESKTYHEKHIQIKADDPESYYWVGVIDWTLAWQANREMRAAYNKANVKKQIKDDEPLPANLRDEFASKYSQDVDEAIDYLKKAMDRKPDYDDAMAYLNLVYRQKADMVSSPDERAALIKQADDLIDQVKQIKQRKGQTQGD